MASEHSRSPRYTNSVDSRFLSQLQGTATIGNMASEKEIVLQTSCVCNAPDETSVLIPIEIQEDDSENEDYDEDDKLISYTKVKFSQNITLTQKPSETLTVTVMFKWENQSDSLLRKEDQDLSNTFFTAVLDSYYIKLNFHNYIHEITEDYIYVIELKVLKLDNIDNHKYHVNLFSKEIIRKVKEIFITDPTILVVSLDELRDNEHFCLKIKRFNRVSSIVKEHPATNNIGMILLKDGHIYSDVSLSNGEKLFPAHKLILSSKSEVFKAMFAKEIQVNKSDTKKDVIKIDDVEVKVIEEMLNFIYTGKAENIAELSQELFKVAIKYQIVDLKAECEEFFIFNLNFENAVDILELARAYELQSLREKVTAFVNKHEEIMVKEKSYQEFLCRDLTVERATSILKLCIKYNLEYVKLKAFEVVKGDKEFFSNNQEFLDLVVSNKNLSKDFFSMLLRSFK